jgi:hypothetical protein
MTKHIRNEDFLMNESYDADRKKPDKENQDIIDKFFEKTTMLSGSLEDVSNSEFAL